MRHRNYGKKLSRKTEHRRALLRNLVTSLILGERIETTVAKAKATRPLAEWMITLAKRGDLQARRQAASYLLNPGAVKFLFEDLSKRYASRPGGYTRLVHAGWRRGDGADLAILEFGYAEIFCEKVFLFLHRIIVGNYHRLRDGASDPWSHWGGHGGESGPN